VSHQIHPSANRRVTLREQIDTDGRRSLQAGELADGTIQIVGYDAGPGVERAWGPGLSSYDWTWTIKPDHVPALIAALGGKPGDDPIELIAAWSAANDRADPGLAFQRAGGQVAFSNWITEG
jgi:hypothetical protein